MSNNNSLGLANPFRLAYFLMSFATGMVGYEIHHSLFWAVMDWFVWPIAVAKWLVYHEINVQVIQRTFAFLGL